MHQLLPFGEDRRVIPPLEALDRLIGFIPQTVALRSVFAHSGADSQLVLYPSGVSVGSGDWGIGTEYAGGSGDILQVYVGPFEQLGDEPLKLFCGAVYPRAVLRREVERLLRGDIHPHLAPHGFSRSNRHAPVPRVEEIGSKLRPLLALRIYLLRRRDYGSPGKGLVRQNVHEGFDQAWNDRGLPIGGTAEGVGCIQGE